MKRGKAKHYFALPRLRAKYIGLFTVYNIRNTQTVFTLLRLYTVETACLQLRYETPFAGMGSARNTLCEGGYIYPWHGGMTELVYFHERVRVSNFERAKK